MTLSERFAGLFGDRPVQVFDPDMYDDEAARRRRSIVRLATAKADSALQIQVIFLCGLAFTLLIAPLPVALIGYILMQLSELHSLMVCRAVFREAQDPYAPLDHLKPAVRRLSFTLSLAGGVSLFLVYVYTPDGWNLGVLAGVGVAAAYFIPFGKHDRSILYSTLGVVLFAMFIAVLARAYVMDQLQPDLIGAPLALTVFLAVTTFAIAANARVDHFKRVDDEQLIEHAFAELKAESRAKSILLAQLSHELRSPLTGVLGAAELLSTKELPPDQKKLVDVMRESGCGLVSLLDRMLTMSAAEIDAIAIKRAPVVLQDLLAEQVALFDVVARQAGIDLIMTSGQCVTPRMIDEVRARQCIANLIKNAIDHSGASQITVRCENSANGAVFVAVADDGRGIPAHRRKQIFRPFGEKGLESAAEGQGARLGLALSRTIARAMDGDLELADRAEPGAEFVLWFQATEV